MEKLYFQINPSMFEQEKMLHIKAGLRTSLKEKVLDKQAQSMQELRNTVKRIEDIETMLDNENNNKGQMEQPSFSSNFEQQSFSSNSAQLTQYNSACYAIPSYGNNSNYRRNNYRYHHYRQQQQMNRQSYRSDDNY